MIDVFGLSIREKLAAAITNMCLDKLVVYRKELYKVAAMSNGLTDTEIDYELEAARKEYLNSVFDSIWNGLDERNSIIGHRIRIALCNPEITGLPPQFTVEYFDRYGVSAGSTYAICYYAITNKPISHKKDYKTCSMLNHIQAKAIDDEIKNLL